MFKSMHTNQIAFNKPRASRLGWYSTSPAFLKSFHVVYNSNRVIFQVFLVTCVPEFVNLFGPKLPRETHANENGVNRQWSNQIGEY